MVLLPRILSTGLIIIAMFVKFSALAVSQELLLNDDANNVEVKIGALLPLSGEQEKIGKNMLAAMQLAISDLAANNFKIVPIDSELPEEQIISEIIANKVDVVLGPTFSKDAKRMIQYIESGKKCYITFSNDRELSNHGCLMMIGFMPEESVKHLLLEAINKGYDLYAILPNDKYGEIIGNFIRSYSQSNRLKLKAIEIYDDSTVASGRNSKAAFEAIKSKIESDASSEKALFIPDVNALKANIELLPNTKVQYLGSNQWEDENLYKEPLIQGAWFASAPKKFRDKFENRYFANFKSKPYKISALAYDAAAFVITVHKMEKQINKSGLTDPLGFFGITGAFRFLNDGTNERMLSIFEINNGKINEIMPAKESLFKQ